ncbi:MAG: hypothetical protein GX443_02030 [Deltaproteobacteria bacterium]|nr:hypothetical protein [Deltaproteobacteria bacterium]
MTAYLNCLQVLNLLILAWLLRVLEKYPEAYASERGKNLATKEDIGDITKTVEEIRVQCACELKDYNRS